MGQRKTNLRKKTLGDYMILLVLTIMVLMIAVPFYMCVVVSFETSAAYAKNPASLWPSQFTLKNYDYLINTGSLLSGYENTLLLAGVGTAYAMVIMVCAAYAYSRPSFPGKKFLFIFILFTMFFGGGTVPKYLLMRSLKLTNSIWGVMLQGGVDAYYIIIMKNGFESTPPALSEAATIDGANDLQVFFHVMLPLQVPLLATFSLFAAVGYWNAWYWPSLLLTRQGTQPLQLVLRSIANQASTIEFQGSASGMATEDMFSQGMKMAAVVATMLPIMCVYPFLQKYFTKGVLVGSVKM